MLRDAYTGDVIDIPDLPASLRPARPMTDERLREIIREEIEAVLEFLHDQPPADPASKSMPRFVHTFPTELL
jgi:hypothetical protein